VASDRDAPSAARASFENARNQALGGRFDALQDVLARATDDVGVAQASVAATLRWMAGLPAATPDPIGVLDATGASHATRCVLVEAAARRATASLLRFDADRLQAHARLADALARNTDEPIARLRAQLATTWRAIAEASPCSDAQIAELEHEARRLGCAEIVVDAAAARGLALAEAGRVDEALTHARRACRMGRTERLPQSEYLAGLVLARLRRLTGQPHMATRIASALRRIAPPPWHDWVDWEITMGSGATPAVAQGPARELQLLLHHANDGDRPAFASTLVTLRDRTSGFGPLHRDVDRIEVALDPDLDPAPIDPAVGSWCRGVDPFAPAPHGLGGLNGPQLDEGPAVDVSLVIARPNRPGRRVLRAARGLVSSAGGKRWLADRKIGRTEGLVSALALIGPEGTDDESLFRSVYGFAYAPALHRGTFDVALHRARARVEPFGRIVRGGGRMLLEVERSFVVPDPRSTAGPDSRVLGRLARAGELSARELARTLGMPLRTVQDALRGLVDDGVCRQQRAGRQILYAIEDTTFQEPTLA
jgi:hypothetical protein